MVSTTRRANFALFLVVVVWGATFVSVQKAIEEIPVHSFHVLRFGIASAILLPMLLLRGRQKNKYSTEDKKILWKAGLLTGVSLWLGYTFQTTGAPLHNPSAFGISHRPLSHRRSLTGISVLEESTREQGFIWCLPRSHGLGLHGLRRRSSIGRSPGSVGRRSWRYDYIWLHDRLRLSDHFQSKVGFSSFSIGDDHDRNRNCLSLVFDCGSHTRKYS